MILTENPENTVVSDDAIQCLPVEDVKGSQPLRPDSGPCGGRLDRTQLSALQPASIARKSFGEQENSK